MTLCQAAFIALLGHIRATGWTPLLGHVISILYTIAGLGKLLQGFQVPLISDYLKATKTRLMLLTLVIIYLFAYLFIICPSHQIILCEGKNYFCVIHHCIPNIQHSRQLPNHSKLPFTAKFLERIMYVHSAPQNLLGLYNPSPSGICSQVTLKRSSQNKFSLHTKPLPSISLYLYFFFILLIITSHTTHYWFICLPQLKCQPHQNRDFVFLMTVITST